MFRIVGNKINWLSAVENWVYITNCPWLLLYSEVLGTNWFKRDFLEICTKGVHFNHLCQFQEWVSISRIGVDFKSSTQIRVENVPGRFEFQEKVDISRKGGHFKNLCWFQEIICFLEISTKNTVETPVPNLPFEDLNWDLLPAG